MVDKGLSILAAVFEAQTQPTGEVLAVVGQAVNELRLASAFRAIRRSHAVAFLYESCPFHLPPAPAPDVSHNTKL